MEIIWEGEQQGEAQGEAGLGHSLETPQLWKEVFGLG